jgi:hypothetical protein
MSEGSGWIELKSKQEYWQPVNDGDHTEGVICDIDNAAEFGMEVSILDKEDRRITLPSHKVLQDRLWKAEIGQLIRVTYKGEMPNTNPKHRPTKIYKVEQYIEPKDIDNIEIVG